MERGIQYAQTVDGVSIGFWTLGEGRPLVYMAGGPWNHIELWQVSECRRWYERLAQKRMLVRYDLRGTGLSERSVSDYSLDAQMLDLEAVVGRLDLDRFQLLGAADAGPVAITYGARHPDRVSHLILWCAWAKTSDIRSPRLQAWRGLIDQDWQLMTDTCAHLALGWSGAEVGRLSAERLRESVTPEAAKAALEAIGAFDVTALLRQVKSPTLVLHRREISWLPTDIARGLAAGIRDARLIFLDGEWTAPYLGDPEAAAIAIDEFLSAKPEAPGRERQQEVFPETALSGPRTYPDGLTERQVEVLRLLASGRTNNEIAEELVLSVRTVERHIGNIYGKIGARGRADATAYALTRSLV